MTKYEWESELKKNIHRLPSDEINRVMEYYDELFADKIERGYGEIEIISQFGNPVDVADKILSEYDGELAERKAEQVPVYGSENKKDEPEAIVAHEDEKPEEKDREEQKTKKEKPKSGGRRLNTSGLVLFVILNILTAFALFIVVGSLWIVACSVIIAGFGCIGGGVLEAIFSLISIFRGYVASGFAQCGVCIAACGFGIIIVSISGKIIKFMGKATGKLFSAIGNWICPKEAAHD